jgi:Arc/MetJ-type ribon-helix-helix transcriptional regulator
MNRKTRIITLYLTEDLFNQIDNMVRKGVFVTKSELVRTAIRHLIEEYREEGETHDRNHT